MLGVHPMMFRRYGRSLHYRIDTAEDLARVGELDGAHWVATGAPLDSLNCDRTFLELVDADGNGRIMCFEVEQAIRWLTACLCKHDGITAGSTTLRLEAVDTEHPEGGKIERSVRKILAGLGLAEGEEVTLDQVRQIKEQVEGSPVSEKGVVLPSATEDQEIRAFLADVVACTGGAAHPSGEKGVARPQLDQFLIQAQAYLDWHARGRLPAGQDATEIMPLGKATPAAYAAYAALADKVDEYFAQCEAVAQDPRAAAKFRPTDEELAKMQLADPEQIAEFLRAGSLAEPRDSALLTFDEPANPHYAKALADLRARAVEPAMGETITAMSKDLWQRVGAFYAAHDSWVRAKAGSAVEPLGAKTLRKYLDETYRDKVAALIAASAGTAFELDNIRLVEKAVLYQAYLLLLANNFVSFPHLYDPASRAMFELGSLVMDGRRLEFCVKVQDRAAHSHVTREGNMFVLYLEVIPVGEAKKFEIAAAVTAGGKGKLALGKRGVFQDIYGAEYDARVVQIIENPISLSEAFVAPFKRLGKLIGGKIEAIAAKAEKSLDQAASTTLDQVKDPKADAAQAQAKPAPAGGMSTGTMLMGGGVALAALGSSLAYIFKSLASVSTYQLLIGLGVAILAVLLPTSILSVLKLRARDLSSVLEGSGWAINARMRLTRKLSRTFTHKPKYPQGAWGVRWWQWSLPALAVAAVAVFILGWAMGWWW